MVLFPSMLYYPYTHKVHIHLMDLDESVRVTLHLASGHGVPNVTLEEQGSDILQLNWPCFSNISTPPAGIYEVAHLHISIQGGSLQVSEQKKVLVKALELGTLSTRMSTSLDKLDPSRNRIAQWQGTGRNGCFSTKVLVASFNLTSFHYKSWLYGYASLLEEGTGEHSHADSHPMMLKGTNGSALKKKEFLLVVNARGETQRKTLLTDGSGRTSFELDTSGWNYKVFLHGELKDDPPALEHQGKKYLNYQSVTRYLCPFSSDSKRFLKIRRVEKKLPCGQPQQLRVDYLSDEKATGIELQSLDVVFLVLAKGTIASVLRKELPAEAGLRRSFSPELPIGPELVPMAKVLGYVVLPDGEMVADSTELKVAKCFPGKVNLSFSEQRALVGSRLRLKVQAAPGTLCSVYAMDQRMQSSGPKGKLNPSMTQPARSVHLLPPCREGNSAEVPVPDAVTKWEAGMFCTSLLGLGLAPAITLTTFKPFFVELALSCAVVCHETFTLVATIINYLRQCLRDGSELEPAPEAVSQRCPTSASAGEVNVTVIAKALRSEKLCGTEMPVVPAQGRVDTETKLLMVQPPRLM
ncbi:alpha-2-macroglobulin-like protein 1 [Aptenodytes patagonicus]|uniref:alpha-2-macroglobulin-like protein 1 n=1 Tax=Aptenodytes patagonicus TaxID=9234 RepID=UPI003FA0823C